MGPVIDEKALNKIKRLYRSWKKEGRLVTGGTTLEDKGNFVLPTVFSNVAHDSTIMQEEILGL